MNDVEYTPTYQPPSTEQPPQHGSAPRRARPTKKRGWLIALVITVSSVVVLAGGGAALYYSGLIQSFLPASSDDYPGPGSGQLYFTVSDTASWDSVAIDLQKQGVVKSSKTFYALLLEQETSPVLTPGVFDLKKQMSNQGALTALTDGKHLVQNTVVIPEGSLQSDVAIAIAEGTKLSSEEIAAALADVGSYGLPAEATTLEGFLFPATYNFSPNVTAHDVVQTLVDRCFEALDTAGVAPTDRYKTIVFASLIQKEAGLRDDYYKVSRVFTNRLNPDLWPTGLLESDATVAYGSGHTERVSTTDAERADVSNPYNTYVHPGMVFAPISNPGDLAIDAALHPADGPWLFFVTWNLDTGETIFSTTVDEHDAAVRTWLDWMDEHPEYQ